MNYASEVAVLVGADTRQAERGLQTVSGQINALAGAGTSAGQALNRGLTVGATAIAGLATASIGMAAGFDQAMRNVNSIAGLSEEAFASLKGNVLEFASTTRAGASGIADALYEVVSAGLSLDETLAGVTVNGVRMSEGMAVLQAATLGAEAGLADVNEVTRLLASAMGAYGMDAGDAAHITDVLMQTVNAGLTTLPALAGSLGRILPTAANLGVSLEEVGFAMAQMTNTGLSTEEAATRLNAIFTDLLRPSKDLDSVLQQLGVSSGTELISKFGGLMGAISALTKTEFTNTVVTGGMSKQQGKMAEELPYLQRQLAVANEELAKMTAAEKPNTTAIERKRIAIDKLTDKIADYSAELAKVTPVTESVTRTTYNSNEALAGMFNNVRSLGGVLSIMSDDATLSKEALQEFAAAAEGATERMREEQFKSFNAQLSLLKSNLGVLAIQFGDRFLPPLTEFVKQVTSFVQNAGPKLLGWIDGAAEKFNSLSEPVRFLAGLFGGLFVASRSLNTMLRLTSPVLGMMGISIGAIGAPVLALIGGVATLAKAWKENWGGIRDFVLNEIAPGLENAIGGIRQMITGIWEGLATGDWDGVKQKVKYGFLRVVDGAREAFEGLTKGVSGWLQSIDWTGAFSAIKGQLKSAITAVLGKDEASKLFEGIETGLARLEEFFKPTIDRIKEAAKGFSGEMESTVKPALDKLKGAFDGLVESLAGPASTISGILAAIGLVISKFFGEWVAQAIERLPDILAAAADGLAGVLTSVSEIASGIWDAIQKLSKGDTAGALASAKGAFSSFVDGFGDLFGSLGTIADEAVGGLYDAIATTVNDLSDLKMPSWDGLKKSISEALDGLDIEGKIKALEPVFDLLKSVFDDIKSAAGNFVDSLAPVGDKLGTLGQAAGELFKALEPAGKILFGLGVVIVTVLGELLAGVLNNAGTILGGFVTTVTGIVQTITGIFEAFSAVVKRVFEGDVAGATDVAQTAFVDLVTGVTNIFAGLGNMIIGVFGVIYDTVAGAMSKIPGVTVPLWAEVTSGFQITTEGAQQWAANFIGASDQVASSAHSTSEWVGTAAQNMASATGGVATAASANATIVSSAFGDMASAAGTADGQIGQSMSNIAGSASGAAEQTRSETVGWLQTWVAEFSGASDQVGSKAHSTSEWVGTAAQNMANATGGVATAASANATIVSSAFGDMASAAGTADVEIGKSLSAISGAADTASKDTNKATVGLFEELYTQLSDLAEQATNPQAAFAELQTSVSGSASVMQTDLDTLLGGWNSTFTEMAAAPATAGTSIATDWITNLTNMTAGTGISMSATKTVVDTGMADVVSAVGQGWSGAVTATSVGGSSMNSAVASAMSGAVATAGSYRGAFAGVGGDLMSGLQGGIMARAGAIAAAAAAVVSAALAAARLAADAHSPSRATQALGWDWVLGLVQGINQGQPAAVKAATDLMSAIGQASSSIVKGLVDLSSYRFAVIDFATLNQQITDVVANLRRLLATLERGGNVGDLKKNLEPLGGIFQTLGNVLKPLYDLASDPLPANLPALVSDAVALLSQSVPALVTGLAALGNQISLTQGVTAAAVGSAVATAVEAVVDISNGLTALSGGVPRINVAAIIASLEGSLASLVTGLAQIEIDIEELRRGGAIAQELSEALAPWTDMADALVSIAETADFPSRVIVPIAEKLKWTVFVLVGMTEWLAGALDDAMLDASVAAAERLVKALSPWKTMADAVKAVATTADLPSSVIVPIADKLKWTAFVLIGMIDWLAGALDDGVLATSAAAAERMVKALSPWKTMADAVKAIAETAELPSSVIVPIADKLKWTTFVLVGMINEVAQGLDDGTLAKAADAAERIVKALSPWAAMADAVKAIADSVDRDVTSAAMSLVSMVSNLVGTLLLLTMPTEGGVGPHPVGGGFGLTDKDLRRAGELAGRIAIVLEPWQDAVAVLKAMTGVVMRDTSSAVQGLAGFMAELARGILLLVAPSSSGQGLTEAMLTKAAKLAELLSGIFDPWERAIALAEDLRMFRLMPDFVDRMVAFGRQWVEVVDQLGRILLTLSRDGLEAVRDFGDVLDSLTGGLQGAMELLLAETWPEPSAQVWDDFVAWIVGIFGFFYDHVQALMLDPANVIGFEPVGEFSGALESLMTALGAAVELLRDFVFVQPDPELWSAFAGWVWGVFEFFYDKVQALMLDPASVIGFEPVGEFAGALQSILESLTMALELARNFSFVPPPAEQWDSFVTWVWGVFQTFYGLVQALVNDPASLIDFVPVEAFGAALSSVMDGLSGGLELARNFSFVPPPSEQWDGFVTWVWGVFQTFYGLVQALVDDPDSLLDFDPVASFGDALGGLMGGLNAAIDMVTGFSFTAPDATTWDGFVTWVTGVFAIFWQFVQTLQTDPDTAINFDPLVSFGDALGAIMGGLQATIDLITNFVWIAPDPEIWDSFITWVMDFMTDLQTRIQEAFPDSVAGAATFGPVADFGNAISSVMGGLQAALQFLEGLAGFIPPAQTTVQNFLTVVMDMIQLIGTYTLQHLEPAKLLAVSRFSTALSDLTSGLSGALSLFEGLASLSDSQIDWLANAGAGTGTDTGAAMQIIGYLFRAIVETLQRFHTEVVLQSGTNWIPTAQAFHTAMSDVIGILQSALNLFTDLGTSGMPSTAQIEAFVAAIMQVFTGFNTGLASTLGPLSTTITAIRDELTIRLYGYLMWQGAAQPGRPYYDVGVNIVQSIGAGMLSQSTYIYDVAYQIGQTILAGLNASLGIASPSQVGMYAGEMTGAGLALGLLNSVSLVADAAGAVADAVVTEFANIPQWEAPTTAGWLGTPALAMSMPRDQVVQHEVVLRVEGGNNLPRMSDYEMREFARELSRHIRVGG